MFQHANSIYAIDAAIWQMALHAFPVCALCTAQMDESISIHRSSQLQLLTNQNQF